ncbi:MAG: carboxypeptidase Taq [Verrucomicrobiales bacterium]|jgi:carboxypeptidase Taq
MTDSSKLNCQPYAKLVERFREISYLGSASALLGWDQETYMPASAIAFRAKQGAYFSARMHELATGADVGDWLMACEDAGLTDPVAAANVREWRHDYDRETKLETALVAEFKEATSLGISAWQGAREKSDFAIFQPHLEKLVELNMIKADAWGYEECRYDALLETYERGARASQLDDVFGSLKPKVVEIVQAALERSKSIPGDLLGGEYPQAQQMAFNREVAEAIGFDFSAGRIDTTAHPFCSGLAPGDVRLTTRYNENDFTSSLFGVLHEAGHGLYEQGLQPELFGTPCGEAVSLGIHESQSRLWENHVGRSRAFWERWLPRAVHFFPHLAKISIDEMTAAVNRAELSHIRVEADEATYDLHVMLRFEMEKRLVSGDLKVADLPAAWNEEFQSMFGLEVRQDAEGCLQDIHWSMGALGYFPTYSLGNLNASQLFARAMTHGDGIESALVAGNYAPLLDWLRKNVHQHGRRFLPDDLMSTVTGESVQPAYHLAHLQNRYVIGE